MNLTSEIITTDASLRIFDFWRTDVASLAFPQMSPHTARTEPAKTHCSHAVEFPRLCVLVSLCADEQTRFSR